jgi:hypothetical protein
MRLNMMRLRLDDLGPNWQRQAPSSESKTSSKCDPRPSDVKITAGNWKSRGVSYGFGTTAQVHSDAIVFATPADAQKTVDAYMAPSVMRCLTRELHREFRGSRDVKLLGITSSVLRRHRVADELAGFRVTLNLAKGKRFFKFFIDGFMVRQDRAVAEFSYMNAFQPPATGTEYTLAEAIAQRGALG